MNCGTRAGPRSKKRRGRGFFLVCLRFENGEGSGGGGGGSWKGGGRGRGRGGKWWADRRRRRTGLTRRGGGKMLVFLILSVQHSPKSENEDEEIHE